MFPTFAMILYVLVVGFLLLSSLKLTRAQIWLCSHGTKNLKKHWQVFLIQGILSFLILLMGLYLKDHWLIYLRYLYWPMALWGPLFFVASLGGFIFDISRKVPEKKPAVKISTEGEPATTNAATPNY